MGLIRSDSCARAMDSRETVQCESTTPIVMVRGVPYLVQPLLILCYLCVCTNRVQSKLWSYCVICLVQYVIKGRMLHSKRNEWNLNQHFNPARQLDIRPELHTLIEIMIHARLCFRFILIVAFSWNQVGCQT